jgi:hypothetical protein
VTVMGFMIMRMRADLHVTTAAAAATFLTHIMISPRRQFPVPARAATRRLRCGNGNIR